MFDILVLVLELIGTVAFAVSGAMTAMKKRMDVFGILILGLVTAVGGGMIRDLILGQTPPAVFLNPLYALVAVLSMLPLFIPAVPRFFGRNVSLYDHLLRVMDALGLSIFTVVGIRCAYAVEPENAFLIIFSAVISGCGGGVLRDVLAGNPPYIFIKHFYASASLLGAILCTLLWNVLGAAPSMCVGAVTVTALRLLAAHFRWSLPHPTSPDNLP